jgi:ribosome-binding factor A
MSRRTERLESILKHELMSIIMRDLSDPRLSGMPSITRVKVTDDMAQADIYMTIMGTPGHQVAALNALKHSAGLMRTKLTKVLNIRTPPFLQFHLDDQLKKELELLELLDSVAKENAELERRRAESEASASAQAASSGDTPTPADASADAPATGETTRPAEGS